MKLSIESFILRLPEFVIKISQKDWCQTPWLSTGTGMNIAAYLLPPLIKSKNERNDEFF